VRCGACRQRGLGRQQAYLSRRVEAAKSKRLVEEREKMLADRLAAAEAEQRRQREAWEAEAQAEALRREMRRYEEQRRDAEEAEARLQAEASRLKGPTFATLFEGTRRLRQFTGG
jgi:lipid II:glycine glycyltransferase (peptidoglycan interpeptide bridge formation enzyme)